MRKTGHSPYIIIQARSHHDRACIVFIFYVPLYFLLVAPKSSEWEPRRTRLIASSSIQIRRKSPPIWHSMHPLYWPVSMCGRQFSGIGFSLARQRSISSRASIFFLWLAYRLRSFLYRVVGIICFIAPLI